MCAKDELILEQLRRVEYLRELFKTDPELAERVQSLKRFQHERFRAQYSDLLHQSASAAAATFFLEELYGPHDFSERDSQFARIVPTLVRLFPDRIVNTVADLSSLHALTEELDFAMAAAAASTSFTPSDYSVAWHRVGRRSDRSRQLSLMLSVGHALCAYTRSPLLRGSLRMMRGPAGVSGLSNLQRFLESGLDTFSRLKHPETFLDTVRVRETRFIEAMFGEHGANWVQTP